ncbi:ATP-dependent helicase [Flavipsychrobacter stenotrophus]|uniref:ATP-dependent helicase n=1 Tax=Flavipsychrobacter stenotrophus TaxID=2077091 RepID=A0A2S7SVZ6_9BACT|nr:DEAD/DEAH box helicase [Flavipsychrobacter stenotrophus]PQJ10787.1 ATP-dependent helicase [Flavipsychrobacter stenotrophus]
MGNELRPYQVQGINRIFDSWRNNNRSVLFQMPTGTGKTVLFSEIVKRGYEQNRKVLIVVHRIELVEQIGSKLQEMNVKVGYIISGKPADPSCIVQVASVQTLLNREYPEANLIVIDECHHAKAESYTKLWAIYPDAKFLGVTATPVRLSGEGFDDCFDDLIVSMSVQEFIKQGYLVPVSHFVGGSPDLAGVKERQGDYVTKVLSQVMMDNSVMTNLIDSYLQKANGKSTIVFAVDVEHSKEIVERYKAAGVVAVHIDAKTPTEERKKILLDFKEKKIQVISNVEIITEGFDFPECEAIQLARPTKSLSLYLQMVGRVMRTAKNKTQGLVLDNASLWLEHGLTNIERQWSLKGRAKNKKSNDENREIGIDNDGIIRIISRNRPMEVQGLELYSLTEEFERLLDFEAHLITAIEKKHKLVSAYLRYMTNLEKKGVIITEEEFTYIQKRLDRHNTSKEVEDAYKYHPSYWHWRKKELAERNLIIFRK